MPAISEEQFAAEFAEFAQRAGAGVGGCRWSGRIGRRAWGIEPRRLVLIGIMCITRHGLRGCWPTRPAEHVDVGSSLLFVGAVSAFVPVKFYDYRPADLKLSGLECGAANLPALPFGNGRVESISCMHVVEHVGLGRYGDPLDPDGDLKAMAELKRVVGRDLLFVAPVGKARVCFNAHRVYAYRQIVEAFAGLRLEDFALIPEHGKSGGLLVEAGEAECDREEYGCGCFWFRR